MTDAKRWQKLTLPLARRAKKGMQVFQDFTKVKSSCLFQGNNGLV
jgi:hypothetical protein